MINLGKLLIVFFVALVALAELLIKVDTRITFFLYFFIIIFFLFSFSKAGALNLEGIFASLFIVIPIIRIIGIFLNLNIFWNNLFFYICFLYLTIVCIVRFKIKPGFNCNKGYYIIYAMIIGIFLGIFSNTLFSLPKLNSIIYLLPLIVFTEELYFRGVLQNYIENKYSRLLGIVVVSLVYALLTLNQGYLQAAFFFIFYLFGSIFYTESKNVYISMGLSLMFHLFYFIFVGI